MGNIKNQEKEQAGVSNKVSASKTIPVMREQVKIEKQSFDRKKVRVEKKIKSQKVNVEVPIIEEELTVNKVPINKYVENPPPAVRHEGNTMIISVLKEVVEKRLVLVEEIHVTKNRNQTISNTEVELREEEVFITNTDLEKDQDQNNRQD
jgi:uncharacterized protein (TIGR02271 family)